MALEKTDAFVAAVGVAYAALSKLYKSKSAADIPAVISALQAPVLAGLTSAQFKQVSDLFASFVPDEAADLSSLEIVSASLLAAVQALGTQPVLPPVEAPQPAPAPAATA